MDGALTIIWDANFEISITYKITGFIKIHGGEILISTVQKSETSPTLAKVWRSIG